MKKTPKRIGTQGWQSILTSKDEILYKYKLAQKYSKSHTVQTFHGNVAEASFREWLTKFLPKRYGVTSGRVISPLFSSKDQKPPHYDVIIYDQIEAPILWHENNPDNSAMGVSRAIPAEYVVSILEVKSSFEPKTVEEAINKLKELEYLLANIDDHNEKYKKFLPKNFCSGLIFFELKNKSKDKIGSLEKFIEGKKMRGFLGALILELEGKKNKSDKVAKITLTHGNNPTTTTIGATGKIDLFNDTLYGNQDKESDGSYFGALLTWNENNFSSFIFDMIAIWSGTFKHGFASSMYGLSYMNPDRNKN